MSSPRFDIITIFPGMFAGPLDYSIVRRARDAGLIELHVHDLRDWTHDRHRTVDDYPFGGGAGMVMKAPPWFEALEAVRAMDSRPPHVVLLSPQGRTLEQALVRELAARERLVLCCGHYEGVDERVRERLADAELSIGDYVLSGGETAAMVVVDAVTRLVPGVLGSAASAADDSFGGGLLEYPQYTRPAVYRGWSVPEILLSGHHQRIAGWRRQQQLLRTALRRPDLLARASLSVAERGWLEAALRERALETEGEPDDAH